MFTRYYHFQQPSLPLTYRTPSTTANFSYKFFLRHVYLAPSLEWLHWNVSKYWSLGVRAAASTALRLAHPFPYTADVWQSQVQTDYSFWFVIRAAVWRNKSYIRMVTYRVSLNQAAVKIIVALNGCPSCENSFCWNISDGQLLSYGTVRHIIASCTRNTAYNKHYSGIVRHTAWAEQSFCTAYRTAKQWISRPLQSHAETPPAPSPPYRRIAHIPSVKLCRPQTHTHTHQSQGAAKRKKETT